MNKNEGDIMVKWEKSLEPIKQTMRMGEELSDNKKERAKKVAPNWYQSKMNR